MRLPAAAVGAANRIHKQGTCWATLGKIDCDRLVRCVSMSKGADHAQSFALMGIETAAATGLGGTPTSTRPTATPFNVATTAVLLLTLMPLVYYLWMCLALNHAHSPHTTPSLSHYARSARSS